MYWNNSAVRKGNANGKSGEVVIERKRSNAYIQKAQAVEVQRIMKRKARRLKAPKKGILWIAGEKKPKHSKLTDSGEGRRVQGSRWEGVTLSSNLIPKFLSQTMMIQHKHKASS